MAPRASFCDTRCVEAGLFDEVTFFRAIQDSGARALLIGRRAMIALGIPVLTADYDLWIHVDDSHQLNQALAPLGLVPNRNPDQARKHGRYVLENSEKVDVMVARGASTVAGMMVRFDDLWERRRELELDDGVRVAVPATDDLILTKRFGGRPKDAEDIRLLEALQSGEP